MRVVLDTNVLVSRLLLSSSTPARAVTRVVEDRGIDLLMSEALLEEIADVLSRRKLDAYVSVANRRQFLRLLDGVVEMVPIVHRIRACRDPRDDKLLELAVNGEADAVVSGDKDLLALDPFRDIRIVTPSIFLSTLAA